MRRFPNYFDIFMTCGSRGVAAFLLVLGISSFAPAAAAKRAPAQVASRPNVEQVTRARVLAEEGKVDEGAKVILDLIQAENDKEKRGLLQMALGLIYFRASRDQEAEAHLQKALDDGIRVPDYARYNLGVLKKKSGRFDPARAEFEKVVDSKMAPQATVNEARYQLAQIALEAKKWKVAATHLEGLRKNWSNDERYPEVLFQLMRTQFRENQKSNACRWARDLYAKYPAHPLVKEWGASLERNLVDGQKTGCLSSTSDLKTRIRRLWLGGEAERALAELKGMKDRLGDEETYSVDAMLANHYLSEGQIEEAMKLVLSHYSTQRTRPPYMMLLAKATARAGENQAAIAAYQRAFELSPRGKEAESALFQAAFTAYQIQDYDGAARRFEQVSRQFPNSRLSRDSRWYMAWIRYLRADYSGAYQSFGELSRAPKVSPRRRGRKSSPGPSEVFARDRVEYWQAMCLLKMGKSQEAIPVLSKLARDPSIGYYSLLAIYRLQTLPGAELPAGLDTRLGMKKQSGGAQPTAEELKVAAEAVEAARAEFEAAQAKDDSADDETETADNESDRDRDSDDAARVAESASGTENKTLTSVSFRDPALAAKFERARDLFFVGLESAARRELREIEKRARSTADQRRLMTEYEAVRNYERSSFIAEIAFGAQRISGGFNGDSRILWETAFPRAWDPEVQNASKLTGVPDELVWGIMRAESHYRQEAQSPVGALGLMQLMPFTGRKVAGLLSMSNFEVKALLVPETNITLGARYLQRLFEKFSGRIPLVAGAYNAGPHRVHAWVRNFGNLEMDEFIEHIPFVETRNYVKRVVRNYQIYAFLYKNQGLNNGQWLVQPVGVQLKEGSFFREVW